MQNLNMFNEKTNTAGAKIFSPGEDRTHDLWETAEKLKLIAL